MNPAATIIPNDHPDLPIAEKSRIVPGDEKSQVMRKDVFRIVLPEGDDPRVREAATLLRDEGQMSPIVLSSGAPLRGIEMIDPLRLTDTRMARYVAAYSLQRPNPNPGVASRLLRKPLYFAGMMVRTGDADGLLAGAQHATAKVIEAGMLTVGLAEGIRAASSFFVMKVANFDGTGERSFIYADCAVNIEPDAQTLADIAIASAVSCRQVLQEEPRVALLSFSTRGSASHASIVKINAALAIVRAREPHLAIDGELQADTALIERVAARKLQDPSAVAGHANVLIFPDLNSGNIAYKLTQYMAGAQATGPVLQGFAKPVSDLSRGSTVADIVATAYLLARTHTASREPAR